MSRKTASGDWLTIPPAAVNTEMYRTAQQHQSQLTKPSGSLGRLEEIATRLAAWQNSPHPCAEHIHITVFVADHGIASEGVSAFPQSVTLEMICNFTRGGAAINVLARMLDATLEIINLGTVHDTQEPAAVRQYHLGPGTANFIHQPAMTTNQLEQALNAGHDAVERAQHGNNHLFIGGEMGIGNTTSATALACSLLSAHPELLTGPGTGLSRTGIAHKAAVISQALALHGPHIDSPLEALRRVGGFEIAALVGAYIHSAQIGLPVLIDGFISTAAALTAERIIPGCSNWFLYSHTSAEPGHAAILDSLDAEPLIALNMRLGEGSGAAAAVHLVRMACRLHNEMATFSQAGISQSHSS